VVVVFVFVDDDDDDDDSSLKVLNVLVTAAENVDCITISGSERKQLCRASFTCRIRWLPAF